MKVFEGKVVFVTGAAKGIGRGVVEYFAQRGATVILCDMDEENGVKTANEFNATFYNVDVTNADGLNAVLEEVCIKFGDIDIIVNNAGIMKFTPLNEISIEEFDKVLATNLRPAFITSRFMARYRNSAEGKLRYGRIVNIASTRYLQSEPDSEAYSASKGGIVSMTHALAISLSEYNITVNCISPGWIATGQFPFTEKDEQQHPSKRIGKPSDIAYACGYLCKEHNDFINGQNIVLDGGMTKKMIYLE